MSIDRKHVEDWLAAYERLWRTPGTDALATLFTEDASYQQGRTGRLSLACRPSPECGRGSARDPTRCSS
ncbi:hypothetical protein NKG94_04510 [Micromonospora sp. M12]